MEEIVSEINSAMGKENQTRSSRPLRDSRYAAGSNTKSCRATDTIRLRIPFPKAWNTEPHTTQYPARRKLRLMVFSAGTPMDSIS